MIVVIHTGSFVQKNLKIRKSEKFIRGGPSRINFLKFSDFQFFSFCIIRGKVSHTPTGQKLSFCGHRALKKLKNGKSAYHNSSLSVEAVAKPEGGI